MNSYGQEIQFTPEEQQYIKDNPTIYYGYDPSWKPLEFQENGTHSGATRDFLDIIENKTGLKLIPHPDIETWSDADRLFTEGELLVLPTVGITDERLKRMDFTDPYLAYPFVIVTDKEADFIGSVRDFEGKTIALPNDYMITSLVESENFPMDIIYRDGLEECMMAVSTGEAEATAGNLCVISHYLNHRGFQNLKIAAPTGYPESEFRMGVNKNHPELLNILEKAVLSITPKEKNEIINNWVSVTYEHGIDMAKIWRIAFISGGIAVVILLIILYWNRKLKSEVNRRKEAEEELQLSFDEINLQKDLIEMQHMEITDSIKYAKRIQEAILPPREFIKEHIPDSFILYKPKDIVAGDFYWMEHIPETETTPEKTIIAAADCTGHGVPGAMVSVVCFNAMNRAVREFKLTDPGHILDKTRELVLRQFEKSNKDVKDGMDAAICVIENGNQPDEKIIHFSGAHNPLWIIRKDGTELEEIKADKQPVGKHIASKPFTTHKVTVSTGDNLYIFSDGFADQFGGSKGKKLKAPNFKKLLIDIKTESLEYQMNRLDSEFEKWKGDYEQIDDVVVIGIRV